MRRFPFRKGQVSKIKYLRYHYEVYINELYIFEQRVGRLLTLIERRCKKEKFTEESGEVRDLKRRFIKGFGQVVLIRGRHTHLRRYKNEKIEQLENLSMFKDELLTKLHDQEYKELRKKLLKEISDNGKALEKILDEQIYGEMSEIVFITLPKHYKSLKNRLHGG